MVRRRARLWATTGCPESFNNCWTSDERSRGRNIGRLIPVADLRVRVMSMPFGNIRTTVEEAARGPIGAARLFFCGTAALLNGVDVGFQGNGNLIWSGVLLGMV